MERPLVDVSPDSLAFELVPNSQPGCVLSVSNSSEVTIAFKVKTTEPRRYLVRPNQGLVGPGESETVNVFLIEKECNQLLREGMRNPASLSKVSDKFLVQTAGLGDRESALLKSVTAAKQSEALTKIWAAFNKTSIRNKKLNVGILISSSAAQSLAAAANNSTLAGSAAAGAVAGGVGMQSPARPRGKDGAGAAAFVSSPSSQTSSASGVSGGGGGYGVRRGGGGGRVGGGGGGGLDESARVLANKYDDLVNYTANLTEERDELNANLEEAKKALQRELATRIALESKGQMSQGRKGSTRGGVRPPANQQRGGDGGFGWVTLSVVASVFFFLGHWLDLASASGGGGGGKGLGAALPAAATKQSSPPPPPPPPQENIVSRTAAAAQSAAAAAAAQAGISSGGEGGEGRSEL